VKRWVSFGTGRRATAAKRHPVDDTEPITGFARTLESLTGTDAWFSPHLWRGDQRTRNAWESCIAVVCDWDYHDGAGEHATPPPEVREKLKSTAGAGHLTGTLFHATPRGARVVFLLNEPLSDALLYERAFLGGVVLGVLDLERAGLLAERNPQGRWSNGYFPDLAVRDLARFFYAPRATVDGTKRDAGVVVLRAESYGPTTLAECAVAFADIAAGDGAFPKEKVTSHPREPLSPTFRDAADRYNADHETDWGPAGGTCPACGHHDCFGRSGPNPARWVCFSANHERDSNWCGAAGDGCWTGDVLDMAAHAAGFKPAEVLRREGYLGTPEPAGGQEVPPTDSIEDGDYYNERTPFSDAKPLTFIDLEAIAREGIPPVDYLLDRWIIRREIIGLFGRAKIGKSTLAADILRSLARGETSCLGIAPSNPVPVLWVDCEQGLHQTARLFLSLGAANLPNLHLSSGDRLSLLSPESVLRLERAIAELHPAVVVIDTWPAVVAGLDENDASGTTRVAGELQRLRDAYDVAFILVCHSRKASRDGRAEDPVERLRGSSALAASVDCLIEATAVPGGRALDVTVLTRRGSPARPCARVDYAVEGDRIELTAGDAPEQAETVLDLTSRAIDEAMEAGRIYRRKELIAALGRDGKDVSKALAHLEALKIVSSTKKGYWVKGKARAEGDLL